MPNFRRRLASLTLLVGVLVTTASAKECLLETDRDAIRGVHEAYRIAWLANDGEAVRRNFTEDAEFMRRITGRRPVRCLEVESELDAVLLGWAVRYSAN